MKKESRKKNKRYILIKGIYSYLFLLFILLSGCTQKIKTEQKYQEGIIQNCIGVSLKFQNNNPDFIITEREAKYYLLGTIQNWLPLNVSFNGSCNQNKEIPDKIYKDISEIPLNDDCYNETRCYIKWNITGVL